MSRINVRTLMGGFTLLAGLGAWVLGKRAGSAVAKATELRRPARPSEVQPEPSEDAIEVPPGATVRPV